MTGQVKRNDPVFLGEIPCLVSPVPGVATPDVDKHKRRFSETGDFIRNRDTVLGEDELGPIRLPPQFPHC